MDRNALDWLFSTAPELRRITDLRIKDLVNELD